MALETCTVCHKAAPRPVLTCTKCNLTTPTFYCVTRCRNLDRSNHVKHCKPGDCRVVYRTGDLIRGIFYAFREATFDLQIKEVKKSGGVLHVYESDYLLDADQLSKGPPYDFAGPLFRFPDQLVPDPEDKARLLSMQACTDSVSFTYEVCRSLLRGVATTVEEAYFSPIRGSQSTARYYSSGERDNNIYAHSVLIVETKDEESYVLDMAGAQNGQFEAVVPTETFIDREIATMSQLHPHGRELGHFLRMAAGSAPMGKDADIRSPQILCQTHQQLETIIQEWENANEMSVRKLVREAPQNLYEQCKTSLLAKVSTELKAFVAQWEKDGRVLKPTASRLIGLPLAGTNKCTIVPDGAGNGSRAYQKWIEANQNHMFVDMPKSSLSSNEEMDRLAKSFKTSTAGMFSDLR